MIGRAAARRRPRSSCSCLKTLSPTLQRRRTSRGPPAGCLTCASPYVSAETNIGNLVATCYICQDEYMPKHLEDMEVLFKALADATRLRILGLLLTGEVCVCHIHESLKIPQPKASRHLAYLRRAGLVETRREGLWGHYRWRPRLRTRCSARSPTRSSRADARGRRAAGCRPPGKEDRLLPARARSRDRVGVLRRACDGHRAPVKHGHRD